MELKLTTLDEFLKQDNLRSQYPYPGLRAFESHESEIYFGRENQIYEIGNKLENDHVVTVIGPSGCGKSSLIRAGLIPELESGLLLSAGPRWVSGTMTPGSDPLYSLAVQLSEVISANGKKLSAIDVRRILSDGDDAIQKSLEAGDFPEDKNLLILVDQFEELFRYQSGIDVATRFVNYLINIYKQRPKNLFVIITMRSDYIGDCNYFDEFSKVITHTLYLTPQLRESELEKAISYPARLFNGEVEPRLVKRLLSDASNEEDPLPLLQHVLLWMWKLAIVSSDNDELVRLSLDNYLNPPINGLRNALSNHAQQLYEGLSDEQKRLTEIIFRLINQKDKGQREIRRVVKINEIIKTANIESVNNDLISVVKTFSATDVSFLRINGTNNESIELQSDLDVGHESLIRNWSALKDWNEYEYFSRKNLLDVLDDAERYQIDPNIGLLQAGKIDLYENGWKHDKEIYQWKSKWPNYQWSRRYLNDKNSYDLATQYFEVSKSHVQEEAKKQQRLFEEKKAEEQRQLRDQLKIRRSKIIQTLSLAVMTVFAILGVWLFQALGEAELARNEAEIAKNKAELSEEKTQIALAHIKISEMDAPKLRENPGSVENISEIKKLSPVIDASINAKLAYFDMFNQTRPKHDFNLFGPKEQGPQNSQGRKVVDIKQSPDQDNKIYAVLVIETNKVEWQIYIHTNGILGDSPIYRSPLYDSVKNSKPEFTFLQDASFVVIGLDKILRKWSSSEIVKSSMPKQPEVKIVEKDPQKHWSKINFHNNKLYTLLPSTSKSELDLLVTSLDVADHRPRSVKLKFWDSRKYDDMVLTKMVVGGIAKEHLALYFDNEYLLVWDLSTKQEAIDPSTEIIAPGVSYFSLSPDGSLLATSIDNNILIWEIELSPIVISNSNKNRTRPLRRLEAHEDAITDIEFVTDNFLYSLSGSGSARVWLPRIGEWDTEIHQYKKAPILLNPEQGLMLDYVGGVYSFPKWDASLENQKVHGLTLSNVSYEPTSISINLEEKQVLIGAKDGSVRLLKHNQKDGGVVVRCPSTSINHIKLSADASKFAAIDENSAIFTGELLESRSTCNLLSNNMLENININSMLVSNDGEKITLTTDQNKLLILSGDEITANKTIYEHSPENMHAQLSYANDNSDSIVRLINGQRLKLNQKGELENIYNTSLGPEHRSEENEKNVEKLLMKKDFVNNDGGPDPIPTLKKLLYTQSNNLYFGIEQTEFDKDDITISKLVLQDIVNYSKIFNFEKLFNRPKNRYTAKNDENLGSINDIDYQCNRDTNSCRLAAVFSAHGFLDEKGHILFFDLDMPTDNTQALSAH